MTSWSTAGGEQPSSGGTRGQGKRGDPGWALEGWGVPGALIRTERDGNGEKG